MALNRWVVIPAYNESDVISGLITSIVRQGFKVAVIDDGSTDATVVKAEDARATVVRHPMNLGQGAAIQTGIRFALALGAQYILTFDGDGQHSADDLPAMLEPLASGHADFTLGSRTLGSAVNLPLARKVILDAATLFSRLSTGRPLTDTHNGIKGMTRRGAGFINLRHNRMAHASEILGQIVRSGLHFVEVPVTVQYSSYSLQKGQKSIGAVRILAELAAGSVRR